MLKGKKKCIYKMSGRHLNFEGECVEVKKIKDQNDHINDGINVIQLKKEKKKTG